MVATVNIGFCFVAVSQGSFMLQARNDCEKLYCDGNPGQTKEMQSPGLGIRHSLSMTRRAGSSIDTCVGYNALQLCTRQTIMPSAFDDASLV